MHNHGRVGIRKKTFVLVLGVAVVVGGLSSVVSRASLSALEGPGPLETWAAGQAKRWLIGRAARSSQPALPTGPEAAAIGEMRFRGECAPCHGSDGRSLSDIGRGMSPRAVDLGDASVQAWSDPELFWIIKHGVRFTGMPGFGAALGDDEIGALVAYVRTIGRASEPR